MLTHKQLRTKALGNADVKAEYEKLSDEYALLDEFLKARAAQGLTQAQVAQKIGVQFFDEDHSSGEERFLMLGMSSAAKLLIVCHCERGHGAVIRIISARKATKRESAFYRGGQT